MLMKSPSNALSPYYYKGGYFHGIHYGSYYDDREALFSMMEREEVFILNSSERRRILIDFYGTSVSQLMLDKVVEHIRHLSPRIIKLAIATDKRSLWHICKAIKKANILENGQLYFSTDMEEGKTWLVSDEFRNKA
ncbi:hypothetical protein EKH84_18545 [Cellulosilyticum sp. WCF-2]|nr:hypothetical protein EKH84_18545 [Cellulosilyticum sp. WCF-2]